MTTRKKFRTYPNDANMDAELGIRTELSSYAPFATHNIYAGDSVAEHKELEVANEQIAEKEIGQQMENNTGI